MTLELAVLFSLPTRLGMGCIALGLMLVAEFGLVLRLRRLSIREYLATRDPVPGTVYYLMLVVFARVGMRMNMPRENIIAAI